MCIVPLSGVTPGPPYKIVINSNLPDTDPEELGRLIAEKIKVEKNRHLSPTGETRHMNEIRPKR